MSNISVNQGARHRIAVAVGHVKNLRWEEANMMTLLGYNNRELGLIVILVNIQNNSDSNTYHIVWVMLAHFCEQALHVGNLVLE